VRQPSKKGKGKFPDLLCLGVRGTQEEENEKQGFRRKPDTWLITSGVNAVKGVSIPQR
jgi:hypothetical protein